MKPGERMPRSSSPEPSIKPAGARKKSLLKEKLELERVKSKDGQVRWTLRPIEDQLTFDKGFYVFIRALQLMKSHNEGVIVVGLAGASGSGKTAFSEKVRTFMPGVVVISMDNYNDGSKVVDDNFDDPRLTDYELLMQNLSDLKAGRTAQIPIYDFKQSKRVGYTPTPVPSSRIIVLEGIYALSDRLRDLLDLKVSITGGVHFDLVKRVLRDVNRSGQGPEEIIQQITDTVYPMYKAFIEPDLQQAQLKIYNAFNPFSGFMTPFYILKSDRCPSQEEARAALGASVQEVRDSQMYDIYLLPPGEDPETCQCWLRMRNRDGRYSLMFEEWVTDGAFIISPRISFEVNVRILSGLMALGYEIGPIMRRTSLVLCSDDVTVKFDDVEGLGHFFQVQGKDREKVTGVACQLGLDGTYVSRSYIEQVQLQNLTQSFQANTAEMKERITRAGASGNLTQVLGASPPSPAGIFFSTSLPERSSASALSSSLPMPMPITSRKPSSGQINGRQSASGRAGLLSEQLGARGTMSPQRGEDTPPGTATEFPDDEGPAVPVPNGRPAANGAVPLANGHLSQHHVDRLDRSTNGSAGSSGAGGLLMAPGQAQLSKDSVQWAKVGEQLSVMAEHVQRTGSLQLQMDAIIHQYRNLNEHVTALTSASQALTAAVARLEGQQPGGVSSVSSSSLLLAGSCLALGAVLGLALRR